MKTNPNIVDYKLLSKAIKFFSHKGYTQVETPWRVSEESINLTFKSSESFKSDDKFLVGSAEQGFLEMISDGILEYGRYMSVSPCFRNEKEDYYHQQEFIKLELIDIILVKNMFALNLMRDNVLKFITKHLKVKSSSIAVVTTNDDSTYGFDSVSAIPTDSKKNVDSSTTTNNKDRTYTMETTTAAGVTTENNDDIRGRLQVEYTF